MKSKPPDGAIRGTGRHRCRLGRPYISRGRRSDQIERRHHRAGPASLGRCAGRAGSGFRPRRRAAPAIALSRGTSAASARASTTCRARSRTRARASTQPAASGGSAARRKLARRGGGRRGGEVTRPRSFIVSLSPALRPGGQRHLLPRRPAPRHHLRAGRMRSPFMTTIETGESPAPRRAGTELPRSRVRIRRTATCATATGMASCASRPLCAACGARPIRCPVYSSVGGLIQAAQPDGSWRDIVIFDS